MQSATVHSPAGTPPGSHRRPHDPAESIAALRQASAALAEYQRAVEAAQSEALGLRNRLLQVEAERDAALRENRALHRTLLGIQGHVDEANAENRRLRELRAADQALIKDLRRELAAADNTGPSRHRRRSR